MTLTLAELARSDAFRSTRGPAQAAEYHVWHGHLGIVDPVDDKVRAAINAGRSCAISGLPGSGKSSTFAAVLSGADGFTRPRLQIPLTISSSELSDIGGDVRPWAGRLLRAAAAYAEDPDVVRDAAASTENVQQRTVKTTFGSAPKMLWQREITQRTKSIDVSRAPDELLEDLHNVMAALASVELRPTLVLDDADGLLQIPGTTTSEAEELADQFFDVSLRAVLRAAEIPALVAVQPDYLKLPGFQRLGIEVHPLPRLADLSDHGISLLLARAITTATGEIEINTVLDPDAVRLLADNRHSIRPSTIRQLIVTCERAVLHGQIAGNSRVLSDDVVYALSQE